MSVSGTIRVLTHAPRGEVDGAVLADGTIVHVPPPVGQQYADLLREGQPLAATGYGTANAYGRSLEATALGPSPNRLQTVAADGAPPPPPVAGAPGPPAPAPTGARAAPPSSPVGQR